MVAAHPYRSLVLCVLMPLAGCLSDLSGTLCNADGLCGEGYLCDRETNRCLTACPEGRLECDGACVVFCGSGGGGGGGLGGGGGGSLGGGGGGENDAGPGDDAGAVDDGGSFDDGGANDGGGTADDAGTGDDGGAGDGGAGDGGVGPCMAPGTFTQTYRSPASVVNTPSVLGWVDAGLVAAADGLVASTRVPLAPGQTTNALVATSFGIPLSTYAQLSSVTVRIRRSATAVGVADYRVQVLRDNLPPLNLVPSGAWPTTPADTTYVVDVASLSADIVSSPGFGVSLVAVNNGQLEPVPQVDAVSITVQALAPSTVVEVPAASQVIETTRNGSLGAAHWTQPQDARLDDTLAASAMVAAGTETHWLYFNGFSLSGAPSLPMTGIVFELKRRGAGSVMDAAVQLAPNGVFAGSPKVALGPWNSTEAWVRYGSLADTWGLSAVMATTALSVGVAVTGLAGPSVAQVNAGRLAVFYGSPMLATSTLTGLGSTAPLARNWTNPAGASVPGDGQSAVTPALDPLVLTNVLQATGYGFTVPSNAQVDTVDLEVTRRATAAGTIEDREVTLLAKGGPFGGNAATVAGGWSTASTLQRYQFQGEKLGPGDVNAADFGARLVAHSPYAGSASAEVDGVRLQVTYTCP